MPVSDVYFKLTEPLGAYDLHKLVYEKFSSADERGFLFSPVIIDGGQAVMLRGDFENGKETEQAVAGESYLFTLRASVQAKKDGKRSGIAFSDKGNERREAWLTRRGEDNGFTVVAVETTAEKCWVTKPDAPFWVDATTFTGILRVTDADLFNTALKKGIGRARAWGFGLMTIKAKKGGENV